MLKFFADAFAVFGSFFPECAGTVTASFFKPTTGDIVILCDLGDDHLAIVDGGFFGLCFGEERGVDGFGGFACIKREGLTECSLEGLLGVGG